MKRLLSGSVALLLGYAASGAVAEELPARGGAIRIPVVAAAPTMPGSIILVQGDSCAAPMFPADTSMVSDQRLWFRAEYLLWWVKDGNVPPLVTTGPQATLGVLGEPGTRVLYDNQDYGTRSGGRFSATYWLDPCQTRGVYGSFFFLGQGEDDFSAASLGDPVLSRPFTNIPGGFQDIEQVANLIDPQFPDLLPLEGRVGVSSRSRLWGAEINGVRNCWNGINCRLDLFGGFRYISLDEGLLITENLRVADNAPIFAGTTIDLFDSFATRNDFYGGQLGARGEIQRGRLFVEASGKVALGATHQQAIVDGATVVSDPVLGRFRGRGGLLALPSNIGSYTRNEFSIVPEVNLNVGMRLTCGVRALVGYNFFYWTDVARPGDQIDVGVNTSQLPPGGLAGPARPAFSFDSTGFWAHGLNFGLELRY